jgi:hypothetical protein
MSFRDYLYERKYQDVLNAESYESFCMSVPFFEDYRDKLNSWLHLDFLAIRARPNKKIYTARTLQMPEALTWGSLFSESWLSWEKSKDSHKGCFVSTRIDDETNNNWQDEKFIHLRVLPREEVREIARVRYGYPISSFEIVQRDDEYLIIMKTAAENGFNFGSYLAVIYDLPDFLIKEVKHD